MTFFKKPLKLIAVIAKKICFILVFFYCSGLYAQDSGYNEAMTYFLHRKKAMKVNHQDTENYKTDEKALSSKPIKFSKYFLGLGYERLKKKTAYNLQVGISALPHNFLQQNLILEWRKSDVANAFSFLYSVQLSSDLFFLSPDFAFGTGRDFGDSKDFSFNSLRLGLSFSNPWINDYMLSFLIYYRRDQKIKFSTHEDLIGLSLKLGF